MADTLSLLASAYSEPLEGVLSEAHKIYTVSDKLSMKDIDAAQPVQRLPQYNWGFRPVTSVAQQSSQDSPLAAEALLPTTGPLVRRDTLAPPTNASKQRRLRRLLLWGLLAALVLAVLISWQLYK